MNKALTSRCKGEKSVQPSKIWCKINKKKKKRWKLHGNSTEIFSDLSSCNESDNISGMFEKVSWLCIVDKPDERTYPFSMRCLVWTISRQLLRYPAWPTCITDAQQVATTAPERDPFYHNSKMQIHVLFLLFYYYIHIKKKYSV